MQTKIFESGDKVIYKALGTDGEQHWCRGVIHAVKTQEDPKNNRILSRTYLVDTGQDDRVDEIVTEEGEENIFIRQPQQIEVSPENIRPDSE